MVRSCALNMVCTFGLISFVILKTDQKISKQNSAFTSTEETERKKGMEKIPNKNKIQGNVKSKKYCNV